MAAEPQIVIRYPLFTEAEANAARQQEAEAGKTGFTWVPVARQLAERRMQDRARALGVLATEIVAGERPPVRVSQVRLDAVPGEYKLSHRWMIRFSGDHLPGGYCEVPVAVDIEADAARHVLAARDDLRRVIGQGIRYPR